MDTDILEAPARRPRAERNVVLRGVSWGQFQKMRRIFDEVGGARLAYLDGELEIMIPISEEHEEPKSVIGDLLAVYFEEQGIEYWGRGSTSLDNEERHTGGEPDESFCIGERKKIPDLVIEVVVTSGGIDKLERYRRLLVPEVWFWKRGRLSIFVLEGQAYRQADRSAVLPGLNVELLGRCVRMTSQLQAVRAFRKGLHKQARQG